MNPFKRPADKTLPQLLRRAVVRTVLLIVPGFLVFYFSPMTMDLAEPENGAAAVKEHKEAMTDVMAKCEPVPHGEFPTAAMVDWKGNGIVPEYTEAPGMVNYLFKVAVKELPLNPNIAEFSLCK